MDASVLPLLLNIEEVLGAPGMSSADFVRELSRASIRQTRKKNEFAKIDLGVPSRARFEDAPPWVVFDEFLDELLVSTGKNAVLVAFDEMQHLVRRIAEPDDPMDDGLLTWLRGKVQTKSNILAICTGSEPYSLMRRRYPHGHTVWRNLEAYDVSFLGRSALDQVATTPVKRDGVEWLPESLDVLWDLTEGHPWVTQILAANVTEQLNRERRRIVAPLDVELAAEYAARDTRISELWWNEKEGLLSPTHRQVAFLVLQNQTSSRAGVEEGELASACQRAGVRTLGRYLEEMKALEVLFCEEGEKEMRWRIRGGFLERHLNGVMQRALRESGGNSLPAPNQELALMLDWENVTLSLVDAVRSMSEPQATRLRQLVENPSDLARRLIESAARYGSPRQRWAVAAWDRPFLEGHQKAVRRVHLWTDMSGEDKDNASDHVLREKIHYVLREHPEVGVYIIGTGDADFGEVVGTLQQQGKQVVLWATRDAVSRVYKHYLSGPDRIRIEWLDEVVLENPGGSAVVAPTDQ